MQNISHEEEEHKHCFHKLHLLKGENLIILWYESLTKINYRHLQLYFSAIFIFLLQCISVYEWGWFLLLYL